MVGLQIDVAIWEQGCQILKKIKNMSAICLGVNVLNGISSWKVIKPTLGKQNVIIIKRNFKAKSTQLKEETTERM